MIHPSWASPGRQLPACSTRVNRIPGPHPALPRGGGRIGRVTSPGHARWYWQMRIRVLVGLPLVLLLSSCAGGSASVPKAAPAASNLAVGGPFTCTDRTGGLGGKGFASLPQVKSLTVDHQDGLD